MTGGVQQRQQSYRVDNPTIQRIVERRNVTFIQTPLRVLPPPSRESQLFMLEFPSGDEAGGDNKAHNHITDDDFLRGLLNCTSVVDYPGSASTEHATTSGRSLEAQHLNGMSAITRRDLLQNVARPAWRLHLRGVPQGGVLEHLEQPTSPSGEPWRHHSQEHRRSNTMDICTTK